VLVKTLGNVPPTDPNYDFLVAHFESIPDCMITLFVLMSSPNLPMYQDEEGLLDARPMLCLFLIMFICFGSFGMIAMLTGVINESMFENNEMRKNEKKLEHEQLRLTLGTRAADLYETLPLDDRGCARVQDLKKVSEPAAELLEQSGITIAHGDIMRFLELMDDNDSGFIDLVDFVHAIEKLAEGVSPLAILEVQHHTALCNKKVSTQLEIMVELEKNMQAQLEKTESEVSRIFEDVTSAQHQHREHLVEKMETQMVHITGEIDRMFQVMTSEQHDHRGQLVETIESQMLRTSEEVDRILKIVTGGDAGIPATTARAVDVSIDGQESSLIVPPVPVGDPASDTGEEVNRILQDVISAHHKQLESLEQKLESQMIHMTEEVNRMLLVREGEQSDAGIPLVEKVESHMLRTSEDVDRILKIVTGGEVKDPRSSPGGPVLGDPARDVQLLSEVRRSESAVLAAVSKQSSKQTERLTSSVQSSIERKFSDLERQRAMRESSDKCVQLALSSQLQDISASLYKLLHEACPQAQGFTKRDDLMEGLRSDLDTWMNESKHAVLQFVKVQDSVRESVETLTSKVCILERNSKEQIKAGDVITSLTDLLSTSLHKCK